MAGGMTVCTEAGGAGLECKEGSTRNEEEKLE